MQLETFQYIDGNWSCETFPELDSQNTWVLVLADNQLPELEVCTQSLLSAYPQSKIMGCSTAGEIFDTQVNDLSISVAVVKLEKSQVSLVSENIPSAQNSAQSAQAVVESINQLNCNDIKGAFVLADGLNTNGTQWVETFETALPQVTLVGGLAGDGARFEATQVLLDGQWQSNKVVAAIFSGEALELGHASKGGWDKFGPERLVTKSEGSTVYELDGKPALELYKTYTGVLSDNLPGSALFFPLGIINENEEPIVRAVLDVNEEDQSLYFAGDIPQGAKVQLMRANFDRVVDGATDAAEAIGWSDLPDNQPSLLVAISCVGRRVVLKNNVEEEVEATLEILPNNTQQVGYYSYGEISPLANGVCGFHNQTMTLTTLRESII